MSEKYTSFNGWYDAEQEKWEATEGAKLRQQQVRERRKRYIAEDAMRLSARFAPLPEISAAPETEVTPAPETTTNSSPASTEQLSDNYETALQRLQEVINKAKTLSGAELAAFLQAHQSERDTLATFLPRTKPKTPTETPAAVPPNPEVATPPQATTPETVSTRERFHLPTGFKTEKGSVYKYTPEGHSERWKFDGSHHEPMGIAVFVEDTPASLDVLTRLNTEQSHLPPDQRKRAYVVEFTDNKARKIYDINDVTNPDRLFFAMINGNHKIVQHTPVSLQPKVGTRVFEISKSADGKSTTRHPGHKVSEVITSKEMAVDKEQLPTSFSEARLLQGNAITNILDAIDKDNDDLESSIMSRVHATPFDRYVASRKKRPPSDAEVDFMKLRTPDNAVAYDKALVAFTKEIAQNNPYEGRRISSSQQVMWRQHDSKAFIKDRIENQTTDQSTARIYLSPHYGMEMLTIYKEIFTKAEEAGLRFKAKVFDPTIRGKKDRIEGYKQRYEFDTVRTDPMVFYAYDDSKDTLLAIASEVYKAHRPAFEGTHTGAIPIEIAPGFAVGSEPKGYSGKESLTTHRESVFGGSCWSASKDPLWPTASRELRLKLLKKYMHAEAIRNNVDPANIAFDLT